MAFISSIEQVDQYVRIETGVKLSHLNPFLKLVERDLQEMIGKDLINQIKTPGEDLVLKEANDYACGLITTLGLSNALNSLKLKISVTGIKLTTPQNTDQPNWWDIKDLQRDLIKTSNQYLNYLFKLFESESEKFTTWKDSPIQVQQKDLLITSLSDFENYYSINGSFTTFIALRPFIRDAQFLKIQKQLKGCYNSEDLTDEMLDKLKAALVNYTISAVADTGLFKMEENGALVKMELMPWEKTTQISDVRLERLKAQRNEIAENYLMDALKEISLLSCFVGTESPEIITIKKKSMLFIGRSRN